MKNNVLLLSLVACVSCGLSAMENNNNNSTPVEKIKKFLSPKKMLGARKTIKKEEKESNHFQDALKTHVKGVQEEHKRTASLLSFAQEERKKKQQEEENRKKVQISAPGRLATDEVLDFEIKEPSDLAKEVSEKRIQNFLNKNDGKTLQEIIEIANEQNPRLNQDTQGRDVNRYTGVEQKNYEDGLKMFREFAKQVNKERKK